MTDVNTSVNFVCQRCLQPLKLDDSFNHIGEQTLAELSLPIFNHPEVDLESQIASLDHFVPAFRLTDSKNGSNGFMLIDGKGESESISQKLALTAGLFDIMSSNSYIDHPLCEECADSLLDLMDQQLRLTEEELNDYNNFLRKIENEDDYENLEDLEKELENLKNEEEKLISELKELQEKEKKAKELLHQEEQEKERLDREEDRYWREYSHHRRDLMIAEDESKSLECQYTYTQSQLEKLKKTNVFNATFHIWHSGGHFGTINSFRLGRLPSAPVDWSEINAAWGQTALLLNALARKISLTFQRYRLVPFGNHSYIEVLEDHKELPLYGSGGIRYLWDSKFDAAMVAFLDCLQQFKEEMERGNSEFCLPYRMEKGKIEDSATGTSFSIKGSFDVGSSKLDHSGSLEESKPPQLTNREKELLTETWKELEDNIAKVGVITFVSLFETHPDVQQSFMSFNGMDIEDLKHSKQLRAHALRVMAFVQKAVARLHEPEKLEALLRELGKKHVSYGAKQKYVELVGPQFILAIKPSLEKQWDDELHEAWTHLFKIIEHIMVSSMDDEQKRVKSSKE